jgi:hypothetical protein
VRTFLDLEDRERTLDNAMDKVLLSLTSLLAGRLAFTPREYPDDRFYAFEGPGTVSKLITGLALPIGIVTG